jgi:hypothetical protein
MKSFHSQVNGLNWRTSSLDKISRFRRPKTISSLLYADFRPRTNAVILLGMGHMLRGECIHEE